MKRKNCYNKYLAVLFAFCLAAAAKAIYAQEAYMPSSVREVAVSQGKRAQQSGASADLGPFVNSPLFERSYDIALPGKKSARGSIRAVIGGRNFSAADLHYAQVPFSTTNGYGLTNLFHDGGAAGWGGDSRFDSGKGSSYSTQAEQIYDVDGNGHHPPAVLRYIGTHCYIFVPMMFFPTLPRSISASEAETPPAKAEWGLVWPDSGATGKIVYFAPGSGGSVLEPRYILGQTKDYATLKLKEIADKFDGEIYNKVREYYGEEADIDGDPKIYILLDDIRDGVGSYRGYFWAGNQLSRASMPLSNEKEMLYIDLFPSVTHHPQDTFGTVAHEFSHMIMYNEGYYIENNVLKGPDRWLEEGLAQYAQFLFDKRFSTNLDRFILNPDVMLADDRINETWLGPSPFANYGASFLWIYYLAEKYGGSNLPVLIKNLVRYHGNGMAAADNALKPYNTDSKKVFADWVIANYLDKTKKRDGSSLNDGKWGYNVDNDSNPANNIGKYEGLPVKCSEKVKLSNKSMVRSANVFPWAGDYVDISGNTGNLNLAFDGSDSGQFQAAVIKRGKDVDTDVEFFYLDKYQCGNLIIQSYGAGGTYDNITLVPLVTQNFNYQRLSYVYSATFDDLKVAVFPNPTFENELHIVVRMNTKFASEPRVQMTYEDQQGYLTMTPVDEYTYLTNYSIKNSGEGKIVVNGTNSGGVILTNTLSFTAVYYPAHSQGLLKASFISLNVPRGSMPLAGTVVVSASDSSASSFKELIRASRSIDIALPVKKTTEPIEAEIPLSKAFAYNPNKLGLYRAGANKAVWLGKAVAANGFARAYINSSARVFVGSDETAPVIAGSAQTVGGGVICVEATDNGSGLASASAFCGGSKLKTRLEGEKIYIDASFIEPDEQIEIEAADNAGNVARAAVRAAAAADEIKDVMAYPNPASKASVIRVVLDGPSKAAAEAYVKIFDSAGHKVYEAAMSNIGGVCSVNWGLTNLKGKRVSNGIYFAEIKASNISCKKRIKIAVVR